MSKIKYMHGRIKCKICNMEGFSTFVEIPTINCPRCEFNEWEILKQEQNNAEKTSSNNVSRDSQMFTMQVNKILS